MESPMSIEELIRELDAPNLTGWKLFAQTSDVTVYQQTDEESKIIRYKCYSHIPDITPDIFYEVAINVEYRLVWDKYLKEAREIDDGEKTGVYWEVLMPLFFDNRDYTFVRDFGECDIDNRHFYYAMARCESFKNVPPRKKIVRVDTCQSQTVLCSDGAKGLKSVFLYYEDPRGNIPKAVWSWAAKFGVPLYARMTHNACKAYPEWIKDKKSKLPNVTEDDIDSAAAAAMITTNDLIHNENEQEKE